MQSLIHQNSWTRYTEDSSKVLRLLARTILPAAMVPLHIVFRRKLMVTNVRQVTMTLVQLERTSPWNKQAQTSAVMP